MTRISGKNDCHQPVFRPASKYTRQNKGSKHPANCLFPLSSSSPFEGKIKSFPFEEPTLHFAEAILGNASLCAYIFCLTCACSQNTALCHWQRLLSAASM